MANITLVICPGLGSISTSLILWLSKRIEYKIKFHDWITRVAKDAWIVQTETVNDHQQSWLSSEALKFMDLIYMTKAEEVYKTLCKCWPHFTYRYNTWYWMVSWMVICLNWNHQDNQGLLNVICLGVQIKGGHHIGHLLESNLSRHTVILHINGPFQKVPFIAILLYIYDDNMDTVWRCLYDTYPRDSG